MLIDYYPAAKAFGWTPSQVDAESALVMRALITIEGVVNELRNDNQRRANTATPPPSTISNGYMAG